MVIIHAHIQHSFLCFSNHPFCVRHGYFFAYKNKELTSTIGAKDNREEQANWQFRTRFVDYRLTDIHCTQDFVN